MSKAVSLEDIVSLCKRRGFIYQGSEVYGGLAGTWDYGPLGVALKRNIMQLWWKMFVEDRDDMLGIDAAILMNQKVWQASGHVDTFTDPLIECEQCRSRFRVDQIIDNKDDYEVQAEKFFEDAVKAVSTFPESSREYSEEQFNKLGEIFGEARVPAHDSKEWLLDHFSQNLELSKKFLGIYPRVYFQTKKQKCSRCGTVHWGDSRTFNMMFKTHAGPIGSRPLPQYRHSGDPEIVQRLNQEDENSTVYLRPETAQGMFTNFKNVVDSFYPDMPFGLAQQGKSFRNEISPRDFVFRSREFEQMEIEYFVHPDNWKEAFEQWVKAIDTFLAELGLPDEKIQKLEVEADDRAHYSDRTIDYNFDFPHGSDELLGLAYRTNFDLKNIERVSKKSMEYRPKDGGAPYVPHVIEPSFGLERAIMAVLTAAYTEDEVNGEKRTYLKLPAHLAPVKVAVSPLLKNKPELVVRAREVYAMLKKEFGAVMWDDNGNIGKRYRRQDEIGTPYCVVIDFDTLKNTASGTAGDTKDTVTVRDRDTTKQERVQISELSNKLKGAVG